jgi:hypothetical protein
MAPEVATCRETESATDDVEGSAESPKNTKQKTTYNGIRSDVWSLGVLVFEVFTLGKRFLKGHFEDLELERDNYLKAVGTATEWLNEVDAPRDFAYLESEAEFGGWSFHDLLALFAFLKRTISGGA